MNLILSAVANEKIDALVASCKEEVAWFGHVEVVDGGYLVVDIVVPKQEISPATWECDEEDVANAMMDLNDSLKVAPNMCYMGHSHVNMGVTPSATDMSYISETMKDETFLLTSIHNKNGNVSALCTIKAHSFISSSPIDVKYFEKENKWAVDTLKEKIKPKKIVQSVYGQYGKYFNGSNSTAPYSPATQGQLLADEPVEVVDLDADANYIVEFKGADISQLEAAFEAKIFFTYSVDDKADTITASSDFDNAIELEDYVKALNVDNKDFTSDFYYDDGVNYA